ncbi:MAG: XRE family transcriptional regulator [Caulobacteraceae bacterium]|nr:XRE family transcriptional regulator [Caulobacteraceae bacterium]
MKMNLGQWVLAARRHKGWTQEQLGERLHLTKGNISAWEKGRHEPSYDRLVEIAALTGYPLLAPDSARGQGKWPLSDDLLEALRRAQPETRVMVENQSRVAVGLPTLRPDERIASAMDAQATLDVRLPTQQSPERQVDTPTMGEFVDLDQQVLDTVRHLARLSHTMTSPQRRAMVAALQGTKETSWDSTHETSSGRTIRPPMEEPGSQPVYRSPRGSTQTARKTK